MPPLLSAAGDVLAEGVEALKSGPVWDLGCGRIKGIKGSGSNATVQVAAWPLEAGDSSGIWVA